MTATSTIEASTRLLEQLTSPAARTLALGCMAWIGLAAFRVKAISLRLFAWRAVLYAALAIPLLGWLLPPLAVPTPAVFQNGAGQRVPAAARVSPRLSSALVPSAPDQVAARDEAAVPSSLLSSIRWSGVAAGIFLALALVLPVPFFVRVAAGRPA